MKNAVNRIKSVLARREVAPHLTDYLVCDGMIHASDGRATAATPIDLEGHFSIPGAELSTVLDRMPEEYKVEVDDDVLKIRAGRRWGKLPLLLAPQVTTPCPDETLWATFSEGLWTALHAVRPFISDNAIHEWTLCACLDGDRVVATNNIVVAQAPCEGLGAKGLVPFWVIDFLLTQDDRPGQWYINENHIAFKWEDGTWLRSQLIASEFHASALKLLDRVGKPEWEISQEWREAYNYVSSITEEAIIIEKQRIYGGRGKAMVEHGTSVTPTPEDADASIWNPKFLTPVIEAATHWDPSKWPRPCSWYGIRVNGLVIGRSR